MVLSKRERVIVVGATLALAVLALDRLVFTPLSVRRAEAQVHQDRLAKDLRKAQALLAHQRQLDPRWREMARTGLKADPAEAESQVLHAMRDWAENAGLNLTLVKPERLLEKSRLPQISFQASGTGSMNAIARLLYRIHTAAIPLKVTELQIAARKEGVDDLSVTLRLSTLYSTGPSAQPAKTVVVAAPETGRTRS